VTLKLIIIVTMVKMEVITVVILIANLVITPVPVMKLVMNVLRHCVMILVAGQSTVVVQEKI